MNLTPISPVRTRKGAFAALVPYFGEDKAMPVLLKETNAPKAYTNFQVVQDSIMVSAAAKLQIGSIFGGATSGKEQGFYFDAIAFTDEYEQGSLGDKVIFATRWGIGIRIAIRVSEMKTDFSFNLGAIAAAVQLGAARAQYEILGLGMGVDGLTIVLDNVAPISDFTYETYLAVKEKVVKGLSDYIKQNSATLSPQPIAVGISQPVDADFMTQAQSVVYAMKRISKSKSLKDAIDQAGTRLSSGVIRRTYKEIVGDIPDTDEPSSTAEGRADKWLDEVS
jgi:hypothetical protein